MSAALVLDRRQVEGRIATAIHELSTVAQSLHAVAAAVDGLVSGLTAGDPPERLRQTALGLQANALQTALCALTSRAMAERLGTLAYLLDRTPPP